MNAEKLGLYRSEEAADDEEGSPDARRDAAMLISQSAGISLLCALALDAVAFDGKKDDGIDVEEIASISSSLMFECWDALTVASGIMG